MAEPDSKPSKKVDVTADKPTEPSSQLQAEQPKAEKLTDGKPKPHKRLLNWWKSHKWLSIPSSILIILLVMVAVPLTRYNLLGLVWKKNFSIQVVDSETKSPVSGATVSLGPISSQTDANGKAVLRARVGKHIFQVSKKYYLDGKTAETVPILGEKSVPSVQLVATGRQVKISIQNTISRKPVADVAIKVADITARTDSSGNATIVLPPRVAQQKATLSASGYNDANVTVNVSDKTIAQNDFTITPAGKVYFLSKRTGTINLMKSNLDGTDQTVVVAGTGSEDDGDTILLASRDWKYLAFKSKRDSGPAKLYYVDTSVDKLNALDDGDASFTMIGWSGDNFIYEVTRNNINTWQPGREVLKSFNAVSGKLIALNQTTATGTSDDYAGETYTSSYNGQVDSYIIGSQLIFSKEWDHSYGSTTVNGKQAGIYSINVDGSGFKTLKTLTYDSNNSYFNLGSELYKPSIIYYSADVDGSSHYYKYQNNNVSEDSSLADAYSKFAAQPYPTYLLSPSGNKTFWVEQRDGQSALIVGDQDGYNSTVVADLSTDFQNYGWFSDNYLFVSKNSSELYVMPSSGVKDETGLVKITDYHKPAYNFYGYGGGYGGL